MIPHALQSTCHQINVPVQKETISLKFLKFEVQRETSLRFPATVGCFSVLHLLVNSVIVMTSQKGSRACFWSNIILLLLEKTRVIVPPWCVNEDLPMGVFEWITSFLYSQELSENHRFSNDFGRDMVLNWSARNNLILGTKCGNCLSKLIVFCLFCRYLLVKKVLTLCKPTLNKEK